MDNIKTIPTVTLVHIVAYELACRIYLPYNKMKTFEELLTEFGYKTEEKQPVKKLTK